MKLGHNLMRTFMDYYQLRGYITVSPGMNLEPKSSVRETKREYKFLSSDKEDGRYVIVNNASNLFSSFVSEFNLIQNIFCMYFDSKLFLLQVKYILM